MDKKFYVVVKPDGTYVINTPTRPTVRFWFMRSVAENWINERSPRATIEEVSEDRLKEIDRELSR